MLRPKNHCRTTARAAQGLCAGLIVCVLLVCVNGCHRGYFRRQADQDALQLIRQKSCDPRWDSASGTIKLDSLSRMFDPFCQDHPPLPPDDPTSHRLMHCVDCKPGYPCWHANGDTDQVENAMWYRSLPTNENGQIVLTLDRAYELALLHSPDLQQQRETLYLSALDVSLERFGFDSQIFAGFNSFLTTTGRNRTGTGTAQTVLSNSLGANSEGISFRKLGITGTTFVAGIANTIMWNFSGNNTQSASSLVNFSLIQPLLRNAGRERILESLTLAERTLLANVRQLERFRRGFYLQIANGRQANNRLNRSGNFLTEPSSASGNVGGFLGLQQQQQQIRNQEFIVKQLELVLDQFRELFLRERINAVQVKQFESTVYQRQQSLLVAKNRYLNSQDDFKRQLGLPPELEVLIEDPFLDRFELIDDQMDDRRQEIGELRDQTGRLLSRLDDTLLVLKDQKKQGADVDKDAKLANDQALVDGLAELQKQLDAAKEVVKKINSDDRQLLEADLNKLNSVRANRLSYLAGLRDSIEQGTIPAGVELRVFEDSSIPLTTELQITLNGDVNQPGLMFAVERLGAGLEATSEALLGFDKSEDSVSQEDLKRLETNLQSVPELLGGLANVVLDMSLLQATIRSNSIEITDVQLAPETAVEIARCFRRDWMNARASLVDSWRQIEFFADQLEGVVDLVFEGSLGNDGDNPFRLNYENGQLRGGFRFDAPLVRQQERNRYREALIQYQQSRRQMYQFEDEVTRNLRQILRTIDQNKILFELNRRSVQVNIEQVELNRFALEEPVRSSAGGNNRLGATTARDLIQALTGLNGALNNILQTWVEYESLRQSLDFDLGTMQLDASFRWIDPGEIDAGIADFAASMLGMETVDASAIIQPVEGLANPPENLTPLQDDTQPARPAFEPVERVQPELSAPVSTGIRTPSRASGEIFRTSGPTEG